MDGETVKAINEAERRSHEYTEKSHTELAGTISKFFGQLTTEIRELKDAIVEGSKDRLIVNTKLDQITINTKETNGRVHKLELQVDHLEREAEKRDSNLEKLIEAREVAVKNWTLKALLIVTMLGSFVWIKESRDAIVAVLKAIL